MSVARKSLLALAGLVVLVVAALMVFLYTFDANQYRGVILSQLSRAMDRPVQAAELELQLLPLGLRLNELRIPEAPGFVGEEFIRARAVRFDINLWSMLRGQPTLQALELDQPTIHLRQDAGGRWNVTTLAPEEAGEEPESAPATGSAELPVRDWLMQDGTIVVERAGQPPLRLREVDLAVTDLNTRRPFPFRVAVGFPSQSRVSATGHLGPINLDAPQQTPLEAELSMQNFRPTSLGSIMAVPPELARLGVVDGTVAINSNPGGISLRGAVTLLGTLAEENVAVDMNLALPADWSHASFTDTSVEYRDARVTGNGRVDLAAAHPLQLDVALTTRDAALESLRALPGRLGLALPQTIPPATGSLSANVKLKSAPEEWQLTGTVQLRQLAVALEGFPQPVRVESLALTLEPNRIHAAPFQVTPEPGFSLTLAGAVEDYRGPARLAARITGDDVPLGPLLALAERFGQNPLATGWKLSGRVSPVIELSGPVREPTQLRYQGTLAFQDLSLTAPQLPEPVRITALRLGLDPRQISADPFTAQIGDKLRAQLGFRLDDYRTRPSLSARLATEGADVAALLGLVRTLGQDPLPGGQAAGRITTTINISGLLAENASPFKFQGQARLEGASVRPAVLAEALGIEQARIEFRPNRLEIADLRLAAAGSKMQGSIRVDNFEAPRVAFDVRGDSLDIEALQKLFGTKPAATAGKWLSLPVVYAQEKPDDWFAKLTGRGRVAFDRLRHGTLTLEQFSSPVVIARQVVTCDPIEFGLYEGGGRGRLVINLRGSQPVTEFDGLLRNVDANKLLSANSESKNRLYGRLGGTMTVSFRATERPQIIQSAKGKGELSLVRGRLAQVNLSRELMVAGQLAGLRFSEQDTPIEDMVTHFEINDGWVRTEDLTLRTPDLEMAAIGGFSLTDELNFEATAVFTPEASQRMRSRSPLGALAGNLLKDSEGRVILPFHVRGTFAQPKFNVDLKRLLEMKLGRDRDKRDIGPGSVLDRLLKRRKPRL